MFGRDEQTTQVREAGSFHRAMLETAGMSSRVGAIARTKASRIKEMQELGEFVPALDSPIAGSLRVLASLVSADRLFVSNARPSCSPMCPSRGAGTRENATRATTCSTYVYRPHRLHSIQRRAGTGRASHRLVQLSCASASRHSALPWLISGPDSHFRRHNRPIAVCKGRGRSN